MGRGGASFFPWASYPKRFLPLRVVRVVSWPRFPVASGYGGLRTWKPAGDPTRGRGSDLGH